MPLRWVCTRNPRITMMEGTINSNMKNKHVSAIMQTDSSTAIKATSKAMMDISKMNVKLPERKENRGCSVLKCTQDLFQSGVVR